MCFRQTTCLFETIDFTVKCHFDANQCAVGAVADPTSKRFLQRTRSKWTRQRQGDGPEKRRLARTISAGYHSPTCR
jgi:hypothetical protein